MRLQTAMAVAFLVVAAAAPAAAADRCVAALVQDQYSRKVHDFSYEATRLLEDRASSDNKSTDASGNGFVNGVPVGATFKSAEGQSSSVHVAQSGEWSRDRLESIASQTLGKNSVAAYKTCVGHSADGPEILVFDATPTAVTVEVRWRASVNSPGTAVGKVTIVGGRPAEPFPATWKSGGAFSTVVSRETLRDVRVVANIGDQTDNEFVSGMPDHFVAARGVLIGSCVGKGGVADVRFWGPPDKDCNNIPMWGKYDAQVQTVEELGVCVGHGSVEGVPLYGPVGAACGGIPVWKNYSASVPVADALGFCIGQGDRLDRQFLWGPVGAKCPWGQYSR